MNLSIKKVPEEVVERLRAQAKRNHRSLQGELLAVLEKAVEKEHVTIDEVYRRVQARGLRTPDEATRWIRELRDSR